MSDQPNNLWRIDNPSPFPTEEAGWAHVAIGQLITKGYLRPAEPTDVCKHQHITGFREVYRNGEFEGVDYDECDVSGMKAIREKGEPA